MATPAGKDEITIQRLMAADSWVWAEYGGLQLSSGPYSTKNHQFQMEILRDTSPRQCARKATQGGWSEGYILKVLHGLIHGLYPQGAWYMFPTQDDVNDFSDSRFKPLIKDNPMLIGRFIKDTDRTNLKRINRANLYFRGARLSQRTDAEEKSLHRIKSFSSDCNIYDEVDEMDQKAIEAAEARQAHSSVKHRFYLGNPTIPDYGIDLIFKKSDQRVWMVKCDHCNHYSCLDIEFPECLQKQADGSVLRVCVKCGKQVDVDGGEWVAQYPDRAKDMVGRWLGHPSSPLVEPKDLLDKWENPRLDKQLFYNLSLGLAFSRAEDRLTRDQIYKCCQEDPMPATHVGPCAMGVDVQGERKGFYVLIGIRPNNYSKKIVKMWRAKDLQEIVDIGKKFHVQCAVIDAGPEIRTARQLQGAASFEVFLCRYKESQHKNPAFDSKEGFVTINRTEICDETHAVVAGDETLILPRRTDEVEHFAVQMCNTAKKLEEDVETGNREYHYIKVGDEGDDYYHAFNYLNLAFMRIGVCKDEEYRKSRKGGWDKAFESAGHEKAGFMGQ